MEFTREELTEIQSALTTQLISQRSQLSPSSSHKEIENTKRLKNKIQSHLLDDGPITVRCPPSVPA